MFNTKKKWRRFFYATIILLYLFSKWRFWHWNQSEEKFVWTFFSINFMFLLIKLVCLNDSLIVKTDCRRSVHCYLANWNSKSYDELYDSIHFILQFLHLQMNLVIVLHSNSLLSFLINVNQLFCLDNFLNAWR